ncbi:MAG: hypothetical protein AAFZ15_07745 [Bacteroidota bacterium]
MGKKTSSASNIKLITVKKPLVLLAESVISSLKKPSTPGSPRNKTMIIKTTISKGKRRRFKGMSGQWLMVNG